jgi:hypothetical protein
MVKRPCLANITKKAVAMAGPMSSPREPTPRKAKPPNATVAAGRSGGPATHGGHRRQTADRHEEPADESMPRRGVRMDPQAYARAATRKCARIEEGVPTLRSANANANAVAEGDMLVPAPNTRTRCAAMEDARADLLASLPPLLGSDEVAHLAGISPAGLRNRVARGDRPLAITVARRLRFHRDEVVNWLFGDPE